VKPAATLPILALLTLASLAQAQGIQRIVGPDGRVTYTDRAAPAPAGEASGAAAATGASEGPVALPYALRQAVQRYPVSLYTGDNCAPCNSARGLLQQRGVPFSEKTVKTDDDRRAFSRLGAEMALPLITVGQQRVSGFNASELARYLDAAGYPALSQLPRGHRNPAPQALAQAAPTPAAAAPATGSGQDAESPSAPLPVAPPPSNPAGIRF
jgi:glutaredoxin